MLDINLQRREKVIFKNLGNMKLSDFNKILKKVRCIERRPTKEELNSKESEILMYDECNVI